MTLVLMAKAFKLNYSTPTNNNKKISSNLRNRQISQPGMNLGQDRQMQMVCGNCGNQFRQYAGQNVGNQNGYNAVQNVRNPVVQNANPNLNGNGNVVTARAKGNAIGNNGNQIRCYNCRGLGYFARNCIVRPKRRDAAYLQNQLLIAQKGKAGIQLQAQEFDLMAVVGDFDEFQEVNANCILMANLQQASTSGTQNDNTPIYDSNGSAEYIELLEPIPEPHQVPQNDSNVISKVSSLEQVASRLGTPLIMDQITTSMCKLGNGRLGFARVLVDVKAGKGLPEKVKIVYKNKEGIITGNKSINVNYDWAPYVFLLNDGSQSQDSRGSNAKKKTALVTHKQNRSNNKFDVLRGYDENGMQQMYGQNISEDNEEDDVLKCPRMANSMKDNEVIGFDSNILHECLLEPNN
nr:zinc knuckle CX2CX4HX4C [Tanacetum cinerariifolium]